ncbi:exported hypothetical protein [Xanthomonas citri pv. citri]|nr:exported hypothetical protein [Xanthomonas citri pv. citri]CEE85693.1 exported hypothetical protein [Xanthomonas citri pv. citri]CEH92136.1 exported hypothetical protein [Xanthomonas citri pv. citri]CEI01147.1 exported hypothetical protein [Xanthomonas citri pv. citri]
MLHRPSLVLVLLLCIPLLAQAQQRPAPAASAATRTQADTNYSFVRYRADYEVRADASSVETDEYEILLKTKSAVEQFSQVRLSYSEKMETLEVLQAYTVTAEGLRQDVAADKIYTQESYSSASAAMYADRKVKVVVFPNLAPGARIVYRVRRAQNTPYFPGYFSLWETFSVFAQYDDAVITLVAPKGLPMHLSARGLQGGTKPVVRGDQARWEWRYQRSAPMKNQNWSAATWEFSPTLMASTFDSWSQMGLAYHVKGGRAAAVTPAIQALADGGHARYRCAARAGCRAVCMGGAQYPLCGGVSGQWRAGTQQRREHPGQPLRRLQRPHRNSGGPACGQGNCQHTGADRGRGWPDLAGNPGAGPLQSRHHLHSRIRSVRGLDQPLRALRPVAGRRSRRAGGAYARWQGHADAAERPQGQSLCRPHRLPVHAAGRSAGHHHARQRADRRSGLARDVRAAQCAESQPDRRVDPCPVRFRRHRRSADSGRPAGSGCTVQLPLHLPGQGRGGFLGGRRHDLAGHARRRVNARHLHHHLGRKQSDPVLLQRQRARGNLRGDLSRDGADHRHSAQQHLSQCRRPIPG